MLSRFVITCVECRGGRVWVFLMDFCVVFSLIYGSGTPFVGCDCMNVEVMDRCMHLK